MIDCFRTLEGETPFISADQTLTLGVEQVTGGSGGYRGVCFSTKPDDVSPHISMTHCECALHVFCREVSSSLSDVLSGKPEYGSELPALHIKVKPVNCAELGYAIEEEEACVKTARFDDQESYSIFYEGLLPPNYFDADRVVTKAEVAAAVARASGDRGHEGKAKVMLVDLVGEEDCMKSWAFMTNDATNYLVNEMGADVLVLNTPSIDRESDGGHVPNHKIIFELRHNLVVELARLAHLPEGTGTVLLNVEPHNTYADCGACRVQYNPDVR